MSHCPNDRHRQFRASFIWAGIMTWPSYFYYYQVFYFDVVPKFTCRLQLLLLLNRYFDQFWQIEIKNYWEIYWTWKQGNINNLYHQEIFLFQIILGWAGDRPDVNAGIIYAICMTLCGGVTALVPVLKSYNTLAMASGAFGLFIAANYSLTCIILVELITLERFANAYGLLLLVQGIANLVGPPLGGKCCSFVLGCSVSSWWLPCQYEYSC